MRAAAVSGTRMTDDCDLTERYRSYVQAFRVTGLEGTVDAAFRGFVSGVKG